VVIRAGFGSLVVVGKREKETSGSTVKGPIEENFNGLGKRGGEGGGNKITGSRFLR